MNHGDTNSEYFGPALVEHVSVLIGGKRTERTQSLHDYHTLVRMQAIPRSMAPKRTRITTIPEKASGSSVTVGCLQHHAFIGSHCRSVTSVLILLGECHSFFFGIWNVDSNSGDTSYIYTSQLAAIWTCYPSAVYEQIDERYIGIFFYHARGDSKKKD